MIYTTHSKCNIIDKSIDLQYLSQLYNIKDFLLWYGWKTVQSARWTAQK